LTKEHNTHIQENTIVYLRTVYMLVSNASNRCIYPIQNLILDADGLRLMMKFPTP